MKLEAGFQKKLSTVSLERRLSLEIITQHNPQQNSPISSVMAASKAVRSEDVNRFVLGALGIYQSCNRFVVNRLGCHSSRETLGQRLTPFFFSMSLRSQQLSSPLY
jgi:predicted naringenin-chalcone synthase